ncbi:MAG: efflux RND transporter permease subunit [Bacteroidota bacterium]|nr:efflux RND transporter permease subunit [Bacteroidota bacterium]
MASNKELEEREKKIASREKLNKRFGPTSWSVDNRTTIYILTILACLFGISTYNGLQKEKFPDIVIPTIMVSTVYPGTSPTDMENLVTRPIEKQVKAISGVKKVTSTSMQNFSIISVEFNAGIDVETAKQRVKDKVDKARTDLPTDLPQAPDAQEINFSDMPIMYVNLSGDFDNDKLKKYAEDLQDKIEGFKEITRVDIVGALNREVQIDVDMYKMQAAKLTLRDISTAIGYENLTISGGDVSVGDFKRSLRLIGQYKSVEAMKDLVINNPMGAPIYLRDIATVQDGFEERASYARLNGKPVVTLNVVKRSGENLISASDQVREAVTKMQQTSFPKGLDVKITGDQSNSTRTTLNDLINTIIIGFILVTFILMFFMGTTNAIFVGLSVPISMFLAFLILPGIGFTLNMIVLFSFLLALGIVVDDAIVVIENTHRIFHQHRELSIVQSAKAAAGEVFIPVLAGTLTTLAPFFPLSFWPGIIGKFMYFLPITLIITLLASLLVAFIINPVFAVSFMKKDYYDSPEEENKAKRKGNKRFWIIIGILGVVALFAHLGGNRGFGNLMIFFMLFAILDKYVFIYGIRGFQNKVLPAFMNGYYRLVSKVLRKNNAYFTILIAIVLLIFSFVLTAVRSPKVVFFPSGDPNQVFVYIQMPVGTDLPVTDSITKEVEARVKKVLNAKFQGKDNPDIESVISNVAVGAGDPQDPVSQQGALNRGKVSVSFVEFGDRIGQHTAEYTNQLRDAVSGIPSATITVETESNGPPTGKPIAIEISGEDLDQLVSLSKKFENHLDKINIPGVEDLKSDLDDQKPEVVIDIDRERANRMGISTGQIASEIRAGIFGIDRPSKFKVDEDEFPIQVRYSKFYRKNIDRVMDMKITYRDMSMGGAVRQIPMSAVATMKYQNTFGGIKRKNLKRVITVSSNVLQGFNEAEVVEQVKAVIADYPTPPENEIKLGGSQEDQAETSSFLGLAGSLGLALIIVILVTQFNSISKPIIILSEVIFSIAGVLLGFSIFKMDISIIMTGVGIIALAGIVVKNGILLVEFADELRSRGLKTREAIAMAGRTRLNPVILTATACILGLIPLALGMNINFFTLFSEGKADFYLGGESVTFWGPLAWTIIFGLSFATFLTLLVVPAMYLLNHKLRVWLIRKGVMSRNHKL